MPLTLSNLFLETKKQYQLELIAGKDGLSNIPTWIYITEDMNNMDFLKGGELIFTTGMSASSKASWLYDCVSCFISKQACGLIINIGQYIQKSDITPELIEFCNQHHFPLILMPWEIYLSEITKNYCNRILIDSKRTESIRNALRNILFTVDHQQEFLSLLNSYGYRADDLYGISVVDISCDSQNASFVFHHLHLKTISYLDRIHADYTFIDHQLQLLIVWHDHTSSQITEHMEYLLTQYRTIPSIDEIFIGIGSCTNQLTTLHTSLAQAHAAWKIGKYRNVPVFSFDHLDIYKIFFHLPDTKVLEDYYLQQLHVLIKYDQKHGSDYLNTLENYLLYDGHIQKIADKMICHRNTINYRLRKIREIFPADIDNSKVKFHLYLAFSIKTYLEIFQK